MTKTRRSVVLAVTAAALLILPATTGAKPKRYVIPGNFGITAELPKSHGYSILLAVSDHEEVEILAYRRSSYVSFSAKGHADGSGLRVDLGRYGQLELTFEPRGEAKEEAEPGCKGRPSIVQNGFFRGVVRLHGERQFIDVATDSIKGSVSQSFRRVCTFPDGGGGNGITVISVGEPRLAPKPEPEPEERADVLDVSRHANGRLTVLSAIGVQNEPRASQVVAGVFERVGRVEVRRLNTNWGRSRRPVTFSAPGAESEAVSVEPRGAFRGKARYEKRPGRRASWRGDLRVLLPGLGPVPLTGPGFHAIFCQPSLVDEIDGCHGG